MSAPICPMPEALAGVALLHGMPLDARRAVDAVTALLDSR